MDPPDHNKAMVDKLDLPFPLLSDPRGDVIKSLDLWNGEEGVSEPAVVVLDRAGTVRRLYSGGTDFSDRPPEEDLLEFLEEVSASDEEPPGSAEPEVRVSAAEAERETVRPDKPALTLDELEPYYLGTYFATVAMQMKLEGEAREEVDGYQDLVNEYNAAIQETRERDSS